MFEKSDSKQKPESSAEKKEIRVFLNDQEKGTFICPVCNNHVTKDLAEYVQTNLAIRIKCKCKCGHVYRALVERRRYFRKPMNVIGTFLDPGVKGQPKKGMIKILNISQSGLQFSVNGVPSFKEGDLLIVEFRLDDEDRSLIREEGIVRRIKSNIVGLEFDNSERYGKLGKYLFR